MILALKILIPSQEDDDALQKTLEKNPGYPLTETLNLQVDGFRVVFLVTPFPATWKRYVVHLSPRNLEGSIKQLSLVQW